MSTSQEDPLEEFNLFAVERRLRQQTRPYTLAETRSMTDIPCGVYAIWTPTGYDELLECLYVGMSSVGVKGRLMQHLYNEPNLGLQQELRIFRDSVRFSFEFVATKEEAYELETEMIKRLGPRFNRNKIR